MQPFAYTRATSLAEALRQGAQARTAYLAGGTELLNWMRLGIAAPAQVVDIGRLADLEGITRLSNGGLRIGALTRLNDAAQHSEVVRDYPVLTQAILKSASAQLRNLDVLLREATGLPVMLAEDPLTAVAIGTGRTLDDLSLLREVAHRS